jgi:hypothetical protein
MMRSISPGESGLGRSRHPALAVTLAWTALAHRASPRSGGARSSGVVVQMRWRFLMDDPALVANLAFDGEPPDLIAIRSHGRGQGGEKHLGQ